MRWMKHYDGTRDSLKDLSKRPHTPYPNAHTSDEIKHIEDILRRNPHIGLSELYGKLKRNYAYTRHTTSLFRFLRKKGIYVTLEGTKYKYVPKPYDTPKLPGEKLQLDVKYVPKSCYTGSDGAKFYQYTIIDEATRERFIYAYPEQSSYSTCDFVLRAIIYFGYIPKCIQTDNGLEFTKHKENTSGGPHLFDILCKKLSIEHKLIKPRTSRHNGKVERSHRNDKKHFYSWLSFYSLDDLNLQMKDYLKRSNNIPSSSLHWVSPSELRSSLITTKHYNKTIVKHIDLSTITSSIS